MSLFKGCPESIISQLQEENAKMRKALADAEAEFDRLAELDGVEYVCPNYSVLEWELTHIKLPNLC